MSQHRSGLIPPGQTQELLQIHRLMRLIMKIQMSAHWTEVTRTSEWQRRWWNWVCSFSYLNINNQAEPSGISTVRHPASARRKLSSYIIHMCAETPSRQLHTWSGNSNMMSLLLLCCQVYWKCRTLTAHPDLQKDHRHKNSTKRCWTAQKKIARAHKDMQDSSKEN